MEKTTAFDVEKARADFPILGTNVWCKPLVYLDNAATSQKPQAVIDAVAHYYSEVNSNVHRGVHYLSAQATRGYEAARDKLRAWINAAAREEIILTRGTTEAINLVAQSFLRPRLGSGDEILITHMEHHSNIVPWQMVCEQTGATLKVVPIDDHGALDLDAVDTLLTERTKLFAFVHISNSLGTINPAAELIAKAHAKEVPVLVDGAQALPHMRLDVQALGCEFYAMSAHKAFGPTGIGALYGKRELLEAMPPYQGGGEMIRSVTFDGTVYNELPAKFEAGTPNIAGGFGWAAALDYMAAIDWPAASRHEHELLEYATERLEEIDSVRLIGTASHKASVVSFVMDHAHPHDIGTILDQEGIAIRTGHHCTQPVMARFKVPATARASFAFYNTRADVDALVAGLQRVSELFHA